MHARLHDRDDRESAEQRARDALAWVGRSLASEAWLQSLRTDEAEAGRLDGPFLPPRAAA
jgi:hypothetical protein